jgi:hypothetical protein
MDGSQERLLAGPGGAGRPRMSGWVARRERQLREQYIELTLERRAEVERHEQAVRDPQATEDAWHAELLADIDAERAAAMDQLALTYEPSISLADVLVEIDARREAEIERHRLALEDLRASEMRRHAAITRPLDRRRLLVADEYVEFLNSLDQPGLITPEIVVEALSVEESPPPPPRPTQDQDAPIVASEEVRGNKLRFEPTPAVRLVGFG